MIRPNEQIRRGIRARRYGRELGETIFNKIEPFADYAFNKSHAYGYALLGYQDAWLKVNYSVEYMAALLTSFRDDKDKASSTSTKRARWALRSACLTSMNRLESTPEHEQGENDPVRYGRVRNVVKRSWKRSSASARRMAVRLDL